MVFNVRIREKFEEIFLDGVWSTSFVCSTNIAITVNTW